MPASAPERAESLARAPIAAEAFLRALADHGVDYFFANPGTDFPPIVEAFARAAQSNAKVPRPVVVPHENLAVAMAHGAFLMNGRAQAVMVHVNVGTANTINNVTNLAREHAPLILAAGRTPVTERGSFGSRSRPIHWAQEMFDQAGMLRELVKWDYELRVPAQIGDVVSRGYEVAMTSPRGPVYMVLPREPLASTLDGPLAPTRPRPLAAPPHPDPQSIATLAQWIAAAQRPLIIVSSLEAEGAPVLARLAERWAVPVIAQGARTFCLPSSHPMHFGFDSTAMLDDADLVLVIESDVPWIPSLQQPAEGARIVHVGEDPAFVRYPMRSFESDLAVRANAASALTALETALAPRLAALADTIEARRARLAGLAQARRAKIEAAAAAASGPISPAYLSRAIGEAFGLDAVIFNEYPLISDQCPREKPGTFFGMSPAGGLGWALGAALGAKLAEPDKLVVATVGDGAYMFTNPTACHWVADAHRLPVLTVVFNNGRYGAVRKATMSMFKDGVAGQDDGRFMADLDPSPPFEALVQAHGGHGERVERAEDVPAALARARDAVVKERRQALLNVICRY